MIRLSSSGMIIAVNLALMGVAMVYAAVAVDDDTNEAGLALGLTPQVRIEGGEFWFGTQITLGEESKVVAFKSKDGALPRTPKTVEPFFLDESTVTNVQFQAFVHDTEYRSEAEKFGWSFVLEPLANKATVEACDKVGVDCRPARMPTPCVFLF
jgi:formylglycine-generating enzyme required for sulfatase activity